MELVAFFLAIALIAHWFDRRQGRKRRFVVPAGRTRIGIDRRKP